jgi:hypothetical protein
MAFSARHAIGFRKFGLGFPLKSKRATQPSRQVRPPVLKPSSLLASEDHLGASDAMPPKPVRFAIYGSTPRVALLTDSELVRTFALRAAFADARSRPSSAVRQIPPMSLLMENLSHVEAPASQARLDVPEPLDVGSPFQAHKIKTAVDGSSLGAVSLSDSKLVSSLAIREAFFLPWEEDFLASPWEEVSRFGVAVIVEATMSEASLAKAVRSPSQAPSLASPAKAVRSPSQAPSLIRRGFFGPRAVSPSPSRVMEASFLLRERILFRRMACFVGGF